MKGVSHICSGWVLGGPILKTVLMAGLSMTLSLLLCVNAGLACQGALSVPSGEAGLILKQRGCKLREAEVETKRKKRLSTGIPGVSGDLSKDGLSGREH